MTPTTPTPSAIPESLLALKESARPILAQRERSAQEQAAHAAADNWQRLLAVARQSLPADLVRFTSTTRPGGFTGQTRKHWLLFVLPQHATIRARFDRDSGGAWTRSQPSGRSLGAEGEGQPAWQVLDGGSYSSGASATAPTLGEALVIAERMASWCRVDVGAGAPEDEIPF